MIFLTSIDYKFFKLPLFVDTVFIGINYGFKLLLLIKAMCLLSGDQDGVLMEP